MTRQKENLAVESPPVRKPPDSFSMHTTDNDIPTILRLVFTMELHQSGTEESDLLRIFAKWDIYEADDNQNLGHEVYKMPLTAPGVLKHIKAYRTRHSDRRGRPPSISQT
jgi:hypothetical protein